MSITPTPYSLFIEEDQHAKLTPKFVEELQHHSERHQHLHDGAFVYDFSARYLPLLTSFVYAMGLMGLAFSLDTESVEPKPPLMTEEAGLAERGVVQA